MLGTFMEAEMLFNDDCQIDKHACTTNQRYNNSINDPATEQDTEKLISLIKDFRDQVSDQLDKIDQQFSQIDSKFDSLISKMDSLIERMDKREASIISKIDAKSNTQG